MSQCQCHDYDNEQQVFEQSRAALPEDAVCYIDSIKDSNRSDSHLISVLHRVQSVNGFLGRQQLDAVAQLMQIPAAKVTGVATFYHFFRLKPRGQFVINVCLGTACYVRGAQAVVEKIKEELGIDFGETTKDGRFTLEATRCLGTCGLAPVMTVNDNVHAKVTPDEIPPLLQSYMNQAKTA